MIKQIFSIAAVFSLLAVNSVAALAAPTATVALDMALSDCESGTLRITTAGISGARELWRATRSDSVIKDFVLGENEESGPDTGYAGGFNFPFLTGPVPFGTAVTLYGYQGSTPPNPTSTAEFAVTYICDTLEILSSSAGPFGTITPLPAAITADIPTLSPAGMFAALVLLAFVGAAAARRRSPH